MERMNQCHKCKKTIKGHMIYKKRLRKPRILMLGMNQAIDKSVDI
jgi:hypothetical protein